MISCDFDLTGDKQGVIELLVLSTSLGLGNLTLVPPEHGKSSLVSRKVESAERKADSSSVMGSLRTRERLWLQTRTALKPIKKYSNIRLK